MIRAIVFINLKMLLIDKIAFLWSILFPTIMVLINRENIKDVSGLIVWNIYIVMTSFIFGVGLRALSDRESALAKNIFCIENNSIKYFIALFIIQTVYVFLCMGIFNFIAIIIFKFEILEAIITAIKVYLLSIPFAAISCNITLFKKTHEKNLNAIMNILIFIFVLTAYYNTVFNKINPIYQMYYNLTSEKGMSCSFIIILIVLSVLSIYSIIKFDYKSMEIR